MATIEERALKKYPMWTEEYEAFNRSNRPYLREGYIKACEEYESLPKIRGWVARDKNGAVFFHREKPHRELDCVWRTAWVMHPRPELDHLRLPNALDIQELNWESEPVEVELIIRKV